MDLAVCLLSNNFKQKIFNTFTLNSSLTERIDLCLASTSQTLKPQLFITLSFLMIGLQQQMKISPFQDSIHQPSIMKMLHQAIRPCSITSCQKVINLNTMPSMPQRRYLPIYIALLPVNTLPSLQKTSYIRYIQIYLVNSNDSILYPIISNKSYKPCQLYLRNDNFITCTLLIAFPCSISFQ